ncbi:hypothetical protein [Nguyenibacter vanlangensis]|uniref:Lipoprotein n=1 Tax=Nguyenibacter vanlangensis TaxID=1216886 RepID=A0A7Y7M7N1_9PROT|nr:hypothetical protein [Nguyenibacter vanlangensis]NVN12189.1 hypothetical protein [Nguyenibacter vanlangensis]
MAQRFLSRGRPIRPRSILLAALLVLGGCCAHDGTGDHVHRGPYGSVGMGYGGS